jgi:hypothetical protein
VLRLDILGRGASHLPLTLLLVLLVLLLVVVLVVLVQGVRVLPQAPFEKEMRRVPAAAAA